MARPFRFRSSVVSGPAASLPLGYYCTTSEFFRRSTTSTNDSIYPPPSNHTKANLSAPKTATVSTTFPTIICTVYWHCGRAPVLLRCSYDSAHRETAEEFELEVVCTFLPHRPFCRRYLVHKVLSFSPNHHSRVIKPISRSAPEVLNWMITLHLVLRLSMSVITLSKSYPRQACKP